MFRWQNKVVLAKIEGAYGTDPVPSGAANAMLLFDVAFQPMQGNSVPRNIDRPHMGNQESLPNELHAVLSGYTELAAAGSTGVAPAWGPLMRAAGWAEVVTPDNDPGDGTVVYTRVTAGHESVTFYVQVGPTLYKSLGARCTGTVELTAQQIPHIRWTITGWWSAPADQAAPTPVFTAFIKPLIVNNTNTPTFEIDSVALVARSFSLDFGNDIQRRDLIGRQEVLISDIAETIAASIEAVPLATFNPYAHALAGAADPVSVELVHGTAAGNIVTIAAPVNQLSLPEGFENQQNITEWPLTLRPLPNEGNDQLTITLT